MILKYVTFANCAAAIFELVVKVGIFSFHTQSHKTHLPHNNVLTTLDAALLNGHAQVVFLRLSVEHHNTYVRADLENDSATYFKLHVDI